MSSDEFYTKPLPLIPTPDHDSKSHGAVKCAVEMVLVHNCLIRAVNSIYYHAPYVTDPEDIRDFLFFVATFVDVTWYHHDGEEKYIFPRWAEATNAPELLKDNVAEHRAFHRGLDELSKYAKTTQPSEYKSEDLVKILNTFTTPLATHLTNEIDSLLAMQKYDSNIATKIFAEGVKHSMEGADKTTQFPMMFGCHDRTFEGGKHYFPPVPRVIGMAMMWWYGSKHKRVWRFCPSDLSGTPKKPEFGPAAA